MDLGKLIVFILALLFFGGIAFLVWSERTKGKAQSPEDVSAGQPADLHMEQSVRRKRRAG